MMFKLLPLAGIVAVASAEHSGFSGSSGFGNLLWGGGAPPRGSGYDAQDFWNGVNDDYDFTAEHAAVKAIAYECGNPWFEHQADDDWVPEDDDHGSSSCHAGVDGCSFQFIKLPQTMAALKAGGFENVIDDDYNDDYTEEDFLANVANGGHRICLPDGFQARMEAEGWSLDNYYSKSVACDQHGGDPGSCLAAGCKSVEYDDDYGYYNDDNNHACHAHSHEGLTNTDTAAEDGTGDDATGDNDATGDDAAASSGSDGDDDQVLHASVCSRISKVAKNPLISDALEAAGADLKSLKESGGDDSAVSTTAQLITVAVAVAVALVW